MRWFLTCLPFFLVGICGCDTAQQTDAGALDLALDATDGGWSSRCPVPTPATLSNLPPGYLAPVAATLVYTVDGDTVDLRLPTGEQRIRLLFVNTEEAFGAEATSFGMATGPIVDAWLRQAGQLTLVPRARMDGTPSLDPFGRWLALLFADGQLVEERIVREGLSAYYTEFGCAPAPVHEVLLFAESEARATKRGIWQPGHPTDYERVLADWIGARTCRPNPYREPYCR